MCHLPIRLCCMTLLGALASCGSGGGFAGNSQKVTPQDDSKNCADSACKDKPKGKEVAAAEAKKAISPEKTSDGLEDDKEKALPPTNPMKKECRGIFVGGAVLPEAPVFEAFEWNFNGDYVTGKVTYTQNNILKIPPVYVKLSFRSRQNDEFIYDAGEIQSTGRKPQNLSFTCKQNSVIQREIWGPEYRNEARSFDLKKKS